MSDEQIITAGDVMLFHLRAAIHELDAAETTLGIHEDIDWPAHWLDVRKSLAAIVRQLENERTRFGHDTGARRIP